MPRLSNFLRNLTIHFRMFFFFIFCFLRVSVSLLCRLQAVSRIYVTIYPCLISEESRNCSSLPHSNETVTLMKHVAKYKNIRKWMVVFLRKIESRGIKIARVNSICIIKAINLLSFFTVVMIFLN